MKVFTKPVELRLTQKLQVMSVVGVLLAVGLSACSGTSKEGNQTCTDLGKVDLSTQTALCPTLTIAPPFAQCTDKVSKCSAADDTTLSAIGACLTALGTCASGGEAAFRDAEAHCFASKSTLTAACQTAFFPGGDPIDGGVDAGPPPDAGKQPDPNGAIDLIVVANEDTFALAWSSAQTADVAIWQVDSFDDAGRRPDLAINDSNARTFMAPDSGTGLTIGWFVTGTDSMGVTLSGQSPDAGVETSDSGTGCKTALDCGTEQVCDLGVCKTQTCMGGGQSTCPSGYQCSINHTCVRQFTQDAGSFDAGIADAGVFVSKPFVSDLISATTQTPTLSADIQVGAYPADRPIIAAVDSARQFIGLEQEFQLLGHRTRLRGKELPNDSLSASPIDAIGTNVHVTYVAGIDTLFACYDVDRGVRVRESHDLGATWDDYAIDVAPVPDGGFSQFHDCAMAPWLNDTVLMTTIDDDQVAIRTIGNGLSVSDPDYGFTSTATIFQPDHPTIATLPDSAIVHVGFTVTRLVSGVADTDVYGIYRDGSLQGYTQPAQINNSSITQANAFPQDYVTIAIDPISRKALAAYASLENQGGETYDTVYVSLWDSGSKTWGTGSDLSVFAKNQTAYLVLPTRSFTDQWDAFSPNLTATPDGKIWMSFLAGKQGPNTDDLRFYLVGFDFDKQSPLATAKGWFLAPAVKMSDTRAYTPVGFANQVLPTLTALGADSQISIYGVFLEGLVLPNGTNISNHAVMITRP